MADTFASVFGSTIADIRTFSSAPLLNAETAVGTTTERESQIDALFAGVRAERLAGVVWFDAAQHAVAWTTRTGASKTTRAPSRRSPRR